MLSPGKSLRSGGSDHSVVVKVWLIIARFEISIEKAKTWSGRSTGVPARQWESESWN